MKTNEAEEGMVPFKHMALLFGEDIDGKGTTVDLHAVEKTIHALKDTKIGLGFDRRKVIGFVKHVRHLPEGVEVEGLVKEDFKAIGRPALAGETLKTDEDDENKILDWKLQEVGWLLLEDDPREKAKGVDPKRLQAAERVAITSADLRDMLDPKADPWEEGAQKHALSNFDEAFKEWKSQKG